MSQASYFQRFAQRENHLTNNTLLMLRHVYQAGPQRLQAVLRTLLDEELSLGMRFEQQIKGTASVPDALIAQPPLSVLIEAKVDAAITVDQIERHLASFSDMAVSSHGRYLVTLTSGSIDAEILTRCQEAARARGVTLVDTTYSDLLAAIKSATSEIDLSLIDIIADYEAFLRQEGVLKLGPQFMIFSVNDSLDENIATKLLSYPADRKIKADMDFLGLYQYKAVRLIANLTDVVCGKMVDGEFVIDSVERGSGGPEVAARIAAAIPKFDYWPSLGADRHRHFLWDDHIPIEFKKRKGGIRSTRRLDLSQWNLTATGSQGLAEAAETLDGASFD